MLFPCSNCQNPFIRKKMAQKFCSVACSNQKHLNNKKTLFRLPEKNEDLAELFGILLGDGSVEKYFARIHLNMVADDGYEKNVSTLLKRLFPEIKPVVKKRVDRGINEIQISSKDACDHIRSLGFDPKVRSVPEWISQNPKMTRAAIRGLFDTEGSIGIKHYKGKNNILIYHQLTFTNKNPNLLQFIEKGLADNGFSPTKNSMANIYISNKADIKRYFSIIGTSNPKLEKKSKMK
jgi:hypothetical protein